MNKITTQKQKGFTLIELVIVIVILGILSAFALPRFADLSGDATEASVEGARGAVKSASAIAHSVCLARSSCDASDDGTGDETVSLEGQEVDMVFGYIAATPTAIGAAADIGDFNVEAPSGDATVPPSMIVSDTDGNCSFTYTEAADTSTPATVGDVTCS
ncbi:MAG: type II secretion system protein [Oleiphilaceae bacterium]|nr:type II secretion system protein [Oleiphilaceae bacterium]